MSEVKEKGMRKWKVSFIVAVALVNVRQKRILPYFNYESWREMACMYT